MRRIMVSVLIAGLAVSGMAGFGPEKPAKSKPSSSAKTSAPAAKNPGKSSAGNGKEPMVRVRAGSPAAPAAAPGAPAEPLSPAAQQAVLVVQAYIEQLRSGQPYDAIDQQFDTDVLLHSVFGAELQSIPAGELRHLSELMRSNLKTLVTLVPMHKMLEKVEFSEPEVTQAGDSQVVVRVRRVGTEADKPGNFNFLVMKGTGGWKIVDLSSVAETWRNEYGMAKQDGMTPTDYLESMLATALTTRQNARESEWRKELKRDADEGLKKAQETTDANLRELEKAMKARDKK